MGRMMRRGLANMLVVCGVLAVAVGAWWIHPAVGMVTGGAVSAIIGIGLIRGQDQ